MGLPALFQMCPWFKWSAHSQALLKSNNEPFIWIRRVGARTHLKHASWEKLLYNDHVKTYNHKSCPCSFCQSLREPPQKSCMRLRSHRLQTPGLVTCVFMCAFWVRWLLIECDVSVSMLSNNNTHENTHTFCKTLCIGFSLCVKQWRAQTFGRAGVKIKGAPAATN